jgi:carbon monoxide dehydrogenase subunit G
MTMSGAARLVAARERVWAELNSPQRLRECIPGCEELLVFSQDEYRAKVKIMVGPISARFTGKVQILDRDPPSGYRLMGEGEGGIAGFARGRAVVTLTETLDTSAVSKPPRQPLQIYEIKFQTNPPTVRSQALPAVGGGPGG